MIKRKGIVGLLTAFLVAMFYIFPQVAQAETATQVEYDITTYAADMQPGWNLGNTFDGFDTEKDVFDETAWGNPLVTKELINSISDQGFKSIRIPVTFSTRTGESPDYTINAQFLNRLQQVVDWSLEAELKVMINIHHDSWDSIAKGMSSDHDNTVARFNSIWMQLSERFKEYPTDLMFESINEPQFWGPGGDEEGQKFLDELNNSFYDIVRTSSGNNPIRPLVIPTLHTNFEEQVHVDNLYNWIISKNDPYIISTVHYYGYWPFSVNVDGTTTFDEATKNHIIDNFNRVNEKFVQNGIPVVIGEFGLLGFDQHIGTIQQGEKLKFFEFLINYANEKDLVHMLWDNGQHFNRISHDWKDPQLYEMMRASWEGRSATAETNFIYLKQGEKIVDVERKLNLNGNTFISLQVNGENLQEGQDYEWNGEILTIKASLLSDLISEKLGKNATLTATFNNGSNWYFDIYNYKTPTFENALGSTNDYAIPVQFNGTDLKTMEAIYTDDSSPAGPQNWTTFKEFGYAFNPSYETNEITFPYGNERFFNELDNGREVELTFHFWSGEQITYTIVKNGEGVEGKGKVPDEVPVDNGNGQMHEEVVSTPQIENGIATVSDEDIEKLANGGLFVIEIGDRENVNNIILTSDQVQKLVSKNANITILKFGISLVVATAHFNPNQSVSISIESENADQMSIPEDMKVRSEIYDLTITQSNNISEFGDNPVTLKFAVNEENVKKLDNLSIYYFNEETKKWEIVESVYKDGVVSANVSHLSIYTVLEKEISTTKEDPNITAPVKDDREEEQLNNEGAKDKEANEQDNNSGNDQGDLPTSEENQEVLPNTATPLFNMMLAGFSLLILGSVFFLFIKRRKSIE
ncbi:cellulase family glycosylhydrolase [Aquibacillus kalidii]|uniref:cellulase family glycosylhydrolase n=1 Tax=Aquibacillus kalidii TaxID=2762597 RepID=UPI0016473B06|nr:cellulase family glycosylhydrolase [Aquibacillus kalidii]